MTMIPGGGPPGGPPPGGQMTPPPDAGPPPGAPPIDPSMMGGAGPPGPPPGPPPTGDSLGAASPLAFAFTDLSADMTAGWQLVDIATRVLGTALKTADFQTQPKTAAVVTSAKNTLTKLISHYAGGGSTDSSTPDRTDRGDTHGAGPDYLSGSDALP